MIERRDTAFGWLAFLVCSCVPAAVMGAVGVRATQAADAAVEREALAGLETAATRLRTRVLHEVDEGVGALAEVSSPLALRAPFAATSIGAPHASAVSPSLVPASESCQRAAAALVVHDPASERPLRDRIYGECTEARSGGGFYLAPLLAITETERPRFDLHAFVLAHAERMLPRERELLAHDVSETAWLGAGERQDIVRALTEALPPPFDLGTLRGEPDARGLVSIRTDTALGAVRVFPDGERRGFVVERGSLDLAVRRLTPPDLPTGARAFAVDAPVSLSFARSASLLPSLLVVVELRDPETLARAARVAKVTLAAAIAFAVLSSFAVSAFLFARARKARRLSELRTDFVSTVSHELRTPASSIQLLAELLRDEKVPPDERAELQGALAREAARLSATLERLLRFGRIEAGHVPLDLTESDLAVLVAERIAAFEERHPGVPVKASLEPVTASVDGAQIGIVIDNLLENAAKYAPSGVPYEVALTSDARHAIVTVKDHGPGVPAQAARRIFEPFERAADRLSEATSGTGIGLSIARGIARAHGGDVELVREGDEGEGATFRVRLPKRVP